MIPMVRNGFTVGEVQLVVAGTTGMQHRDSKDTGSFDARLELFICLA